MDNFAPREHLAICGDILGGHHLGRWKRYDWHQVGKGWGSCRTAHHSQATSLRQGTIQPKRERSRAWGAMALPPPQGAGLLQGGQMCPWHRVLSSLETDKIQGLVHQWAFPISSNFWLFLGRWETGLETRKSLYTEFRLYCMIINVSR